MRPWPSGLKLWIWPRYRLVLDGHGIDLTPCDGGLLAVLLAERGRRLTIGELVEAVFLDPDEEPEFSEQAVRLRLMRLRRKLLRNGVMLDLDTGIGQRTYAFRGIHRLCEMEAA